MFIQGSIKMNINNRIKELRKNKKITQQSLADSTGLTRIMVAKIELNQQPTLKQIEILCDFFNITADYLIKGKNISLNDTESEIIKAVRNDDGLLASLMKIIESKKHLEALAI